MFKILQVPNQQTDCKLISFCSQFAILGLNILNIQNLNNIVLQSVCYFGTCKILNIQNLSHMAVLKVFHFSREPMVKWIKCQLSGPMYPGSIPLLLHILFYYLCKIKSIEEFQKCISCITNQTGPMDKAQGYRFAVSLLFLDFNILNIQNLNDTVLQSICYFVTCKILNIQNLSHKAVLKVFHFSREPMVKWIKCQLSGPMYPGSIPSLRRIFFIIYAK